MDIREKLRKAAGLFVDLPPETPAVQYSVTPAHDDTALLDSSVTNIKGVQARTVDQLLAETGALPLETIHAGASVLPEEMPDANVDFTSVYAQAGIPESPFSAEQALDLIAGMPAELPLETKRQTIRVTVNAMGKAIGATPETIIADASRKLSALAAYAQAAAARTAEFTASTETEIAALQMQIDQRRKAMETARGNQTRIEQACHTETGRLDDVREFFSPDAGALKHPPG